jgi:hypothetical protein
MSNKIKASKLQSSLPAKTEIPPIKRTITFSFQYFDFDNHADKFGFAHLPDEEYPRKLFARLKGVCSIRLGEFTGKHSDALRAHPIDWKETSCPDGFDHMNEQLRPETAYYFGISEGHWKHAGGDGRVVGFLTENIFNIVWLDPRHRLYS